MMKISGYCDLCIPFQKDMRSLFKEAVNLGYKVVAVEQVYDHRIYEKIPDLIPPVPNLDQEKKEFEGKLSILQRISIIFADPSVQLAVNKSKNRKQYDIIAAIPATENAFQHAAMTFNCDIITYNEETIRLKMNRKMYFSAVNRKIAFEIKYSPAIVDSNMRKEIITRAHRYHSYGKSKNIIISSEAKNPFQLRSPYDIANLGLIFGLSEEQAKSSIVGIARKVVVHGITRRHGNIAAYFSKADDSDDYSSSEESDNMDVSDSSDEGGSSPKKMKIN